MIKILAQLAFLLMVLNGFSQQKHKVLGIVTDEHGNGMPGSHVHYKNLCLITDYNGHFSFDGVDAGRQSINVSYIGFERFDTVIVIPNLVPIKIVMKPKKFQLNEISVQGGRQTLNGTRQTLVADEAFLAANHAGSLVKSMENLPGLNSMDIGANLSKPVIRGFGMHRVVVSENGIKQEGQQWGADHGLEIDAAAVERVVLVKGASSLEFGSGALGGNLAVQSNRLPDKLGSQAEVLLTGRAVNQSGAVAGAYAFRGDKFFVKSRASYKIAGDYAVPADTIVYLTRAIPIENRRLKNSAAREHGLFMQAGYISESLQQIITASNLYQKVGFFPGAHGVPDISRIRHDQDFYNIDYPFQEVYHRKVTGNTIILSGTGVFSADWAWQQNSRSEWSQFHTHYPGQTAPLQSPDLELLFKLSTYTANAKFAKQLGAMHGFTVGWQNSWQANHVGGYNFLLPAYQNFTSGLYYNHRWQPAVRFAVNGGLRFDYARVNTEGYFDQVLYDYLVGQQFTTGKSLAYAQRSWDLNKQYSDFSGMLGFSFMVNPVAKWDMNFGRSFRNPTPIELGANGIHHGSFRHEKGDMQLGSERGFYVDTDFSIELTATTVSISAYQYLFSNYIFLNPTGVWSVLPHAGQIYQYTQSSAMLSGIELSFRHQISKQWQAEANMEFIYSRQLNTDPKQRYPLPFSPPANLFFQLGYRPELGTEQLSKPLFFVQAKAALAQNRVARNELTTPGYAVFNIGFSADFSVQKLNGQLWVTVSNLFNEAYFNHLSFYRKLELPEPGRDIRLAVRFFF